jgi:site-specific recombinase XerD
MKSIIDLSCRDKQTKLLLAQPPSLKSPPAPVSAVSNLLLRKYLQLVCGVLRQSISAHNHLYVTGGLMDHASSKVLSVSSGQELTRHLASGCHQFVPALIDRVGPRTSKRFVEFFVVTINNKNTRDAYYRACCRFFAWCDSCRIANIASIEPLHVAAYVEALGLDFAKPTVKQHLAAIRMLFDWLVIGQVVAANPAISVRGPKYDVTRGVTPILTSLEVGRLLRDIDTSTLVGLRDRALIGLMVFSFARISAALLTRVDDYFVVSGRRWIRLREKGGRRHEMPVHHALEEYIDSYIRSWGLRDFAKSPLFRAAGVSGELLPRSMSRTEAYRMVRRRAEQNGLDCGICCHSFRATGITIYLGNGGTLERAQAMAGHKSPKTTKLYDRTDDVVTLKEVERIVI